MERQTKSRQRGAGYIEVLTSSLILALCLLGALSLFGFSMTLVSKTGDQGVAYNISRRNIENARQQGFGNLPEGTSTIYYDNLGNQVNAAPVSGFKMVMSVVSDKLSTQNGVTFPASDAIRTVTVNVYKVPSNEQIEQSGTLLARSGV